uniref:CCHC-type domain-containing protein n=1 Tax=Tanacetum cinerariifolium TaxID=118510 RepID=A0A6L2KW42_TANCI|nr:hypothetical protein [Tanacetum cinerariifolium]
MSSSMITYMFISFDSDLPPWGFHLIDPNEFEPLPADASPTALSPGYVADSDPLEDDLEEDPKEDPEEEEASEEDEDKEEEHLAPNDSAVLPSINHVPSAEETELFKTDKSAATPPSPPQTIISVSMTRLHRAQISVRPHTPPSPSTKPLIAKFEVKESSTAVAARQTWHTLARRVDYRFIDTLDASPSTYHPLHVPSPPLLLPFADRRSDIPQADMSSQKSLCLTATASRFEVGESSTAAAAARQTRHTLARRLEDRSMTLKDLIRIHKAHIIALEAQTRAFQRDVSVLQRQRIDDGDRLMSHIQHEDDRFRELARTRDTMAPKRTTTPMNDAVIKQLIAQGIADALAEYEATKNSRNGDDRHDSGSGERRIIPTAHECTYSDFLKCKPLNFKVLKESQVEKYVGGLPDMIQGSVVASKPKTMQEAIEFATDLMDHTFAERQAENKRKLDDNTSNNVTQQQPHKRQNVARAYTDRTGEKTRYSRSLPLCTKGNYHHNGQCASKCNNCKKVGHSAHDCRSLAATANN